MNIQEIRQQYPQYDNLSDEQLARALHAKYYSGMDFGEFSQKIGLSRSGGPTTRYSAKRKPEKSFLGEMASNIPGSAARLAGDIYNAVRHPIDTIDAIGQVGAGAIQLAIPGEQGYEPAARQVGEFYKGRYGGVDETLNTLKEDPVGVLSDVAGVLTGVGTVAPKAAGVVGRVGAALDPVNIATKPVRAIAKRAIPASAPEKVMKSSLKLGTTYTPEERTRMVRTLLDENYSARQAGHQGYLPNVKGNDALAALQQTVGSEIDRIIAEAARTGQKVPIQTLTNDLWDLVQRSAGPTLSSADDLRSVFKVVDDYMREMQRRGITELDAAQLQDFKTSAYRDINWKKVNTPGEIRPAAEEAQRRMARSARQEIEGMAPGIAPANERYGRLAELREPMARATNRIDNRDLVGIGTPLKMTTGAVTGGAGGAATGWIAAILDAPTPKARLARAIDALRKNPVLSADAQYAAFVRQLAAEAGVTNSLLFGEDQTPSQNTLMLMGY